MIPIPGTVPGRTTAPAAESATVALAGRWRDREGRLVLGVRFTMAPKWHIYWRNPGDSGIAPRIEPELPRGWSPRSTIFPRPEIHRTEHETTIGYHDHATLLLPLEASSGAGAGATRLVVHFFACKEVCIAGEATLLVDLPAPGEIAGLPLLPETIDGRSYPRPLEALGATAVLERGRLVLQGPYPGDLAGAARAELLSLELPGATLPAGPIQAGRVEGGRFRFEPEYLVDPGRSPTEVTVISGLVTFGAGRADPCVDFSLQVPADAGR